MEKEKTAEEILFSLIKSNAITSEEFVTLMKSIRPLDNSYVCPLISSYPPNQPQPVWYNPYRNDIISNTPAINTV